MDRASSGLQLEPGGATGKICAAAFYPSESVLGGSESGSWKEKKRDGGSELGERLSSLGVMEKLSAMGAGGGARSYSDFMRSLAAKYNNNEYVFLFFCFCFCDIVVTSLMVL